MCVWETVVKTFYLHDSIEDSEITVWLGRYFHTWKAIILGKYWDKCGRQDTKTIFEEYDGWNVVSSVIIEESMESPPKTKNRATTYLEIPLLGVYKKEWNEHGKETPALPYWLQHCS